MRPFARSAPSVPGAPTAPSGAAKPEAKPGRGGRGHGAAAFWLPLAALLLAASAALGLFRSVVRLVETEAEYRRIEAELSALAWRADVEVRKAGAVESRITRMKYLIGRDSRGPGFRRGIAGAAERGVAEKGAAERGVAEKSVTEKSVTERAERGAAGAAERGAAIRAALGRAGLGASSFRLSGTGKDEAMEFTVKAAAIRFLRFLRDAAVSLGPQAIIFLSLRNDPDSGEIDATFRTAANAD